MVSALGYDIRPPPTYRHEIKARQRSIEDRAERLFPAYRRRAPCRRLHRHHRHAAAATRCAGERRHIAREAELVARRKPRERLRLCRRALDRR